MSTNLCTDACTCGYKFGIPDFVGKPIEFRKYGDYRPQLGTKLICPSCGIVYFGWIRSGYDYWSRESLEYFDKDTLPKVYPFESRENKEKGKFAKRYEFQGKSHVSQLGFYQIDIAYYETYRDEGIGVDTDSPSHLCAEDCPLTRLDN